jgi:hypothetical protein
MEDGCAPRYRPRFSDASKPSWRVVLPAGDGLVTLRRFAISDGQLIVDERDAECDRWLGPGSGEPSPTACIEADGHVVGWIDADPSPEWLQPGEANVGYSIFPAYRGNGYAARAVRLLAAELDEPGLRRALLVIDVDNHASLRVARAAGGQVLPNRLMRELPTSVVYSLEFSHHHTSYRRVPAVEDAAVERYRAFFSDASRDGGAVGLGAIGGGVDTERQGGSGDHQSSTSAMVADVGGRPSARSSSR